MTVSVNGESIKRSYSISSSPTERDYCEITVKREEQGAVSRFLHDEVHEDDTLQITAPSGRFTFTGEEWTSVVLIGGGVGVTPMMSVARYLTKRSWLHDIYFVLAARGEADIIFREELQYLQHRYRNLHVTIVAEEVEASDERYVKGRITRQVLESRIPISPLVAMHICGPPPMMNAVKAILTEMGVLQTRSGPRSFKAEEQPRAKLESVPAAQAKVAVVTFAKSNRTAMMPPTKTVLEASEDVGVNIEYSCRVGTCGVCRTNLLPARSRWRWRTVSNRATRRTTSSWPARPSHGGPLRRRLVTHGGSRRIAHGAGTHGCHRTCSCCRYCCGWALPFIGRRGFRAVSRVQRSVSPEPR